MEAWVQHIDEDNGIFHLATHNEDDSVTVFEIPFASTKSTQTGGSTPRQVACMLSQELASKQTK